MSNFIIDCINGDALISEIDDYVDRWHEETNNSSLEDFLGMSKKEYSLYLESDEYLPFIIRAHKEGQSIAKIMSESFSLVARSENAEKSKKIIAWLKREGLWDQ